MVKNIILLSDKSSGSTILQKELLKHPDINAVNYTMHNEHETLFWLKAARILNYHKSEFFECRFPFKFSSSLNSVKGLIKKNDLGTDFNIENKEDIFRIWESFIAKYCPVFFEKSPHHLNHWASTSLIIDFALKHPDEVKIIGLVRNPLAVTYSTMKRWTSNPDWRLYKWAYTYRNLMQAEVLLPREGYRRVSYEDMISNPGKTFQDICDFIEVPYVPEIGSDIHTKSANKFANDENFTPIIQASVKLVAEYFGYHFEERSLAGISNYKINRMERMIFIFKSKLSGLLKLL
jgi:sulfotransferase family protein